MNGPRETNTDPGRYAAPWEGLPAEQQPQWRDHPQYARVRARLRALPALVTVPELRVVENALSRVARGDALLLQAGDCAESFDEVSRADVHAKAALLDALADRMGGHEATPVIRLGRMGGQFAKPRSLPVERHGEVDLPVFRGHMINSPEPRAEARRHDPGRMLRAYRASAGVHARLTELRGGRRDDTGPWSSHEALVLDYENVLARVDPGSGRFFLGSTHVPWVGERTRQPDGAHVRLLAEMTNPVGCKIGPRAHAEDVLRVCGLLDHERRPGRLTLVVRMGARHIAEALPPLVSAVRRAGHPVVWLSDPMHGNTRPTASGVKTRYLRDIFEEAVVFRRILENRRLHPGGLHLEVTALPVTECVGGRVTDEREVAERYLSLCDPRLNAEQAEELIDFWCGAHSMLGRRSTLI